MTKKRVIALIILIGVVGFFFYIKPLSVMEEVDDIIASNSEIIQLDDYWRIGTTNQSIGIIVYPGARVPAKAYVPLAVNLSLEGYTVFIPDFFINFAFFGINKADEIMKNEDIEHWYLAGHSLGGAMAAEYLKRNPSNVQGLIFLASYPSNNTDLSDYSNKFLIIYADRDGLISKEDFDSRRSLLPSETQFIVIQGGNHANFGYYGEQNGDLSALITREEQHSKVVEAIKQFIN